MKCQYCVPMIGRHQSHCPMNNKITPEMLKQLANVPTPSISPSWKCINCGKVWRFDIQSCDCHIKISSTDSTAFEGTMGVGDILEEVHKEQEMGVAKQADTDVSSNPDKSARYTHKFFEYVDYIKQIRVVDHDMDWADYRKYRLRDKKVKLLVSLDKHSVDSLEFIRGWNVAIRWALVLPRPISIEDLENLIM